MATVDHRTLGEVMSDKIAAFGGSWRAIFLGIAILVFWIGWNVLTPFIFDPSLILLNLFLSCVAAFQAPIILMSQRRAERKQDEAYRALFAEIKKLVIKDIVLEKKILKVLGKNGNGHSNGVATVAAEAPALDEPAKEEDQNAL